jgi:plastocyanin
MNALLLAAALAALNVPALVATTPNAAAAGSIVHIKNFAYSPATLTVAPGTTVRFVNDDGEAHTVTAVDKSFDSAGLDTGDAWTHAFTRPGTYAYFCAMHPYMKGSIVVRATGGTTP